jgi:hypothetical protein
MTSTDDGIVQILQELSKINNRLEALEAQLIPSSKKLNDHIDFVERVYSTLQLPFRGLRSLFFSAPEMPTLTTTIQ